MKKFLDEFKAFAMRGNVIDMAVGVVVGGAFSKIVTSLVNDVIMPCVTLLTGAADFTSLSFVLKPEMKEAGEVISEAIAINYGSFLQNIIDFVIIAFSIFIAVKLINKLATLKKKEEEEEKQPEPPKGPTSEELLVEIRDLLKEK